MYHGIPIIGVAGGIGSGKSHVARLFGELGCLVIDSDAQVAAAYGLPAVRDVLRNWWGDEVLLPGGTVDRRAIARRVFADPAARRRLEGLIHPVVARARDAAMARAVRHKPPLAFVWDAPLLFETGLNASCDAVVFVDAPLPERRRRVRATRGWDEAELARRENSQWPLDNKRALSDYVLANTAQEASPASAHWPGNPPSEAGQQGEAVADPVRDQARLILSRILAYSLEADGSGA